MGHLRIPTQEPKNPSIARMLEERAQRSPAWGVPPAKVAAARDRSAAAFWAAPLT